MGGVGGVLLGVAATAIYANIKGWAILVPPVAVIGGIATALLISGIAGLYPAARAARLSPTEALRAN
jgi:putative ABC transport system permease protein